MTDAELIARLRDSKGWSTLGNAAADRIEALIAERDALRAALAEAREKALREAADELRGQGYGAAVRTILALIEKPQCV